MLPPKNQGEHKTTVRVIRKVQINFKLHNYLAILYIKYIEITCFFNVGTDLFLNADASYICVFEPHFFVAAKINKAKRSPENTERISADY